MNVATFTRSRRDSVASDQVSPETEDDFKVRQGGAWSRGHQAGAGGREASFVCLAEYAILSPGHTPHRMSGQLTPLWLPQVS